jgi:hypothetical protein
MADQTGIDIRIRTQADVAGARQAAQQLDEVKRVTEKVGQTAASTGKQVNDLGENFDKGAAAGRVIGEVARGNVLALGQLGAAIKALGALLKANLIGGLITLGSLAATVLLPLIKGFRDSQQAAEKASKAVDATAAALAVLDADRAKEAAAAMAEIAARASDARQQIDAVTQAITAQADADEAVALATISADESLTPLQRAERTADVRGSFRTKRQEIQLGQLAAQEQVSAAASAEAADQAAAARRLEEDRARLVERIQTRSPAQIEAELASARDTSMQAQATAGQVTRRTLDPEARASAREAAEAAIQRVADLQDELADAEATYAQRLKAAQDRLLSATEARAAAEEAAAKAAAAEESERSLNAAKRTVIGIQTSSAGAVSEIELEARRRSAEREAARQGTLELVGTDSANAATGFAQQLQRTPAGRDDPAVRSASEALAAAASAAREGGTTEAEAEALLSALREVAAVLAENKRSSATLQREIDTLRGQIATLRTR